MPRSKRMFFRKWFDKNFVISKKCVARQNSGVASRCFQNHAEFNKTWRRHSADVSLTNLFGEVGTVVLIPQHCKNRRGVQNHLGNPRSSYRSSAWSTRGPLILLRTRFPKAIISLTDMRFF